MTDAAVGVKQSSTPDRQIDAETVETTLGTVWRQRVAEPIVQGLMDALRMTVNRIQEMMPFSFDASSRVRSILDTNSSLGTVSTVTTVTTVSTVTSATNLVQISGQSFAHDQIYQGLNLEHNLREKITVS
jgi:hypothetical protein